MAMPTMAAIAKRMTGAANDSKFFSTTKKGMFCMDLHQGPSSLAAHMDRSVRLTCCLRLHVHL